MPMFERNYENWYIWSRNGLSGPFWPPFRPKLVKMAQHHYFLASDAKSFPTRGHMPRFGLVFENLCPQSEKRVIGPKKIPK